MLLLVGQASVTTGMIGLLVIVQDFRLANVLTHNGWRDGRSITRILVSDACATGRRFLRVRQIAADGATVIKVTVNSGVDLVREVRVVWACGVLSSA